MIFLPASTLVALQPHHLGNEKATPSQTATRLTAMMSHFMIPPENVDQDAPSHWAYGGNDLENARGTGLVGAAADIEGSRRSRQRA